MTGFSKCINSRVLYLTPKDCNGNYTDAWFRRQTVLIFNYLYLPGPRHVSIKRENKLYEFSNLTHRLIL